MTPIYVSKSVKIAVAGSFAICLIITSVSYLILLHFDDANATICNKFCTLFIKKPINKFNNLSKNYNNKSDYPVYIYFRDVSRRNYKFDLLRFRNFHLLRPLPLSMSRLNVDKENATEISKSEADISERVAAQIEGAPQTVGRDPSGSNRSDRALVDVIRVEFDLESQSPASNGLMIRKQLYVANAANGEIVLRVGQDTKIAARVSDLERAFGARLPTRIRQAANNDGYVDFSVLRDGGYSVQYDAARDVVSVTAAPASN